jgi:hypothetical protein
LSATHSAGFSAVGAAFTASRFASVAASAQRSIIMSPGSPKASKDALRDAVLKLNKDPGFRAAALKSVNFVPFYDVGSAEEKILAASAKLSPSTVEFLKGYIAKVEKKKK